MPTKPADDEGSVGASSSPSSILLTVAYDGAALSGFAPQPEVRTVSGELLAALRALDPSITSIRGASRTDAGVHARGQIVAFDPERNIPPRGWVLGVNAHLPRDVAVRRARVVPHGYEPRASRLGKRYRYLVMRDPVRDPLLEHVAWRVGGRFDLELARAEASTLLGTHDFAAFRTASDPRVDTMRTLSRADLEEGALGDDRIVALVIEGTAFLHNMVRIIAGTLVDVAQGRIAAGAVKRAIASLDRRDLGITAPAHGLVLDEVFVAPNAEWGASWP